LTSSTASSSSTTYPFPTLLSVRPQRACQLFVSFFGSGQLLAICSGWFEYDIPDAPYPSVKRCCALYETKGERRLGTHLSLRSKRTLVCLAHGVLNAGDHVIVGLENALPLLLQNRLDLTSLLSQFEERR
jgi:hypothetical protein